MGQDLVESTRRSIDRAYSQWKSDRLLQKLYPGVGEGRVYMIKGNVVYRVFGCETTAEPSVEHKAEPVPEGAEDSRKETIVKPALKKVSYL